MENNFFILLRTLKRFREIRGEIQQERERDPVKERDRDPVRQRSSKRDIQPSKRLRHAADLLLLNTPPTSSGRTAEKVLN